MSAEAKHAARRPQAGLSLPEFVAFLVLLLGTGGWVANIVKLATEHEPTGEVVLRAVGIFVAPLGAVMGFL